VLDLRDQYKDVTIGLWRAHGGRPGVMKRELEEWSRRADLGSAWRSIQGVKTPDWKGEVARIPARREGRDHGGGHLRGDLRTAHHDQVHVPCWQSWALAPSASYDFGKSHEMRLGQVRALQYRATYVCKDGPVFTAAEMGPHAAGVLT